MKSRCNFLPACLAALLLASAAPSQAKPDPSEDVDAQVTELFQKLDRNKDGVIDRDEYGAKHADRFDKIDANKDGKIDRQEMKVWLQSKEGRATRPGKGIGRGRGKSSAKAD